MTFAIVRRLAGVRCFTLCLANTGGLGALTAAITIRGLSGGGLGGGDVKMAALTGAVVGYPAVLSAGLVTAIAGGVTAVVLLVTRRAGRRALLTGRASRSVRSWRC